MHNFGQTLVTLTVHSKLSPVNSCVDVFTKFCVFSFFLQFEHANLQPGRDFDWDEEMDKARPHDPVPVPAMDPVYLLYTSGTTGNPKVSKVIDRASGLRKIWCKNLKFLFSLRTPYNLK